MKRVLIIVAIIVAVVIVLAVLGHQFDWMDMMKKMHGSM
jgi:hypothetical protein